MLRFCFLVRLLFGHGRWGPKAKFLSGLGFILGGQLHFGGPFPGVSWPHDSQKGSLKPWGTCPAIATLGGFCEDEDWDLFEDVEAEVRFAPMPRTLAFQDSRMASGSTPL